MKKTRLLAARMVTIVITGLLVAGCAGKKASPEEKSIDAFDALRAEVQKVVTDPARVSKTLELVNELEGEYDAIDRSDRLARFEELNRNYDATREDFATLLDQIMDEKEAHHERVKQTYLKMIDTLTPQEWDQLAKSQSKAMDAALATLQKI